jgi:hypothetical protein
MGTVRLNITLNEELEKKFRQTVADSLGFKKGNLQVAIEEALNDWIDQQIAKLEKKKK